MRISLALLLAMLVARPLDGQRTISAPTDVTGSVNVSGRSSRFTYFFDHNALADAVLAANSLIALTESGNLLRIDMTTLTMSAQSVVADRGTALARDDRGVILLGTAGGRIVEVDPETLMMRPLYQTRGTVG